MLFAVLVECITPRLQRLKVGDIVISSSPSNPYNTICKRLCGMVREFAQKKKKNNAPTNKQMDACTDHAYV
jgi:hypothetical protein